MTGTNNDTIILANSETFNHFQKVVVEELKRLGPYPRSPLTVTRAAEIAEISKNTAGRYVDIMEATGKLEVVRNLPRKDLYLPEYSSGNKGEGAK
jgi:predicted AAA+ superfamily ATPase